MRKWKRIVSGVCSVVGLFAGLAAFFGAPVPAGVWCAASVGERHLDGGAATVPSASVSVDTEDCVETSDLTVLVTGPADDGRINNSHHRSAVSARSWLITVTPNGRGSDGRAETAAAECVEVKGEATDIGRGVSEIRFKLIARGLNAADGSARSCQYDVGVTLPDGYVEVVKGIIPVEGFTGGAIQKEKLEEVVAKSPIPVEGFTPLPNGESIAGFILKVARREVYVVQNVSGGGGNDSNLVEYDARLTCSTGGKQLSLPQMIESSSYAEVKERRLGSPPPPTGPSCCPSSDAEIKPRRLVSLTEGRFDATAGVAGSVITADGWYALVANAVDANGRPCAFRVRVRAISPRFSDEEVQASGAEETVLSNCTVKEDSLKIDLPTAEPQNILEFFFTCLLPEGDTPAG